MQNFNFLKKSMLMDQKHILYLNTLDQIVNNYKEEIIKRNI